MAGEDSREQGIEFGDLADDLERLEYPVDNETLLEEFGDREVEMESNAATLEELLGPQDGTTYESADGVRQAVLTMVGDEAVGRRGYSDRGETGDEETADQETEDGANESF